MEQHVYIAENLPLIMSVCPICKRTRLDQGIYVGDPPDGGFCYGHRAEDLPVRYRTVADDALELIVELRDFVDRVESMMLGRNDERPLNTTVIKNLLKKTNKFLRENKC